MQVSCTTNSAMHKARQTKRKINILDKVSMSFFIPSFTKYEGFKELQTKHKQHMSKFQNTWLIRVQKEVFFKDASSLQSFHTVLEDIGKTK